MSFHSDAKEGVSIPTEGHDAALVSVPRAQLETLRRSMQLGNLLPGEGEMMITLWLMIADAEGRS